MFKNCFSNLPSEINANESHKSTKVSRICEDIITPYRLAADYGVYMAPVPMGYYRFNNNRTITYIKL